MMTGFFLLIAIIYSLLGNLVQGLRPDASLGSMLGALVFTFLSGPLNEEAG
jgi:hypothetical protein